MIDKNSIHKAKACYTKTDMHFNQTNSAFWNMSGAIYEAHMTISYFDSNMAGLYKIKSCKKIEVILELLLEKFYAIRSIFSFINICKRADRAG